MAKEKIENKILIANRIIGKGDSWKRIDIAGNGETYPSLTETLEAYFQSTKIKCDFYLSPINGKLYAIDIKEKEIDIPQPKKYDIYGEK